MPVRGRRGGCGGRGGLDGMEFDYFFIFFLTLFTYKILWRNVGGGRGAKKRECAVVKPT